MALQVTQQLLEAQKAIGEANKITKFGDIISKTLGKDIQTIAKARKVREDEYVENMKAWNPLEEDTYPESWGPKLTAEMERQTGNYNKWAKIVRDKRNVNSDDYINALAGMKKMKNGVASLKGKIENWTAGSLEYFEQEKEGRISGGLSSTERAKLQGYHDPKRSKPIFKDGKFGVEYTYVDNKGVEQTETAFEGQEPHSITPATKEIELINAKYIEAVEKIGAGTFNESAWTQDMRNFVNAQDYDNLKSIAGDFSSVNGQQSFSEHPWVKNLQNKYKTTNPDSEYDQWWQDPSKKFELKEGVTQFFNDVYLPKFREFKDADIRAKALGAAYRAYGNTGKAESFDILRTLKINDDVARATGSTLVAGGETGEIYPSSLSQVFDAAGLTNEAGQPLRVGFIHSGQFGATKNLNELSYTKAIEYMDYGENRLMTNPDQPMQAGDIIAIYPTEVTLPGEGKLTDEEKAKFQPKYFRIPKDRTSNREIENFIRQQYQANFSKTLIENKYLLGAGGITEAGTWTPRENPDFVLPGEET